MHPVRQRRLSFLILVIVALTAAVALVLYALGQNLNAFYTPSQLSQQSISSEQVMRLGGMVKKGSIKRLEDTLRVQFVVTDFKRDVTVQYRGILPDLFREGQGVVVQGRLAKNGSVEASQVLAKHDEKYMPPSVARALKNNTSG